MGDTLRTFWGRTTFCLITGASQGIGRQLAIEIAGNIANNSLLFLIARSTTGLQETEELVKAANPAVHVKTASMDLSCPDVELYSETIYDSMLKLNVEAVNFDLAMIVHNAGTIGDVTEMATDMIEPKKWVDYMNLNLVSAICLNSVFLNIFPVEMANEKCIVNVTSLCGIQPFKAMAYYCVGKASRDMFFRVLALENPSLNVLSYSPGPVDTEMQATASATIADLDTKDMFKTVRESGRILTTVQTTKRCVQILADRKYISGDHVDYFDKAY